ncbi:MAG: hypothetical protein IJH91_01030 [Mogibacterium sp.]|nr:hypothetical protein [Mogibacterium sp.]
MKRVLTLVLTVCIAMTLLAGCGGSGGKEETPETVNAYLVLVVDADNAPVEGVGVQLCSDSTCILQKTDATGYTQFDVEEGSYTIHILTVPEGFASDETEYEVPETYGLVAIELQRAE